MASARAATILSLVKHQSSYPVYALSGYGIVYDSTVIRLLARREGPNLYSTNGMGKRANPINARRLVAQAMPSFSYIWIVNKGNPAPKAYRRRPFAATAEALYIAPYVSSKKVMPPS